MKTLNALPIVFKDNANCFEKIKNAKDFFSVEKMPVAPEFKEEGSYADKDGLIEFIIGNELIGDPVVMGKVMEQKRYLIALTSIVTDYVNRYAAKYGQEWKTNVELWCLALSKLPLMGPSKIDLQKYSRHIKGVSIAKEFIDFIVDVVASEGSSALNSFSKFLEKQGDALRLGIEQNTDYYKTITIGVSVEVVKVGEEIVYIPKIKQYRVNFDRKNSKFSSACASVEIVDIDFEYQYGCNVFDYESLEDPAILQDFNDFIKGQRQAQIENSSTFFNGDFPVI